MMLTTKPPQLDEQEERRRVWHDDGYSWRRVLDILQMFRALRRAYLSLPAEELASVDERMLQFDGFDANGEGHYLRIARILLQEHGLYPELRARANVACDG